MEEEHALRQLAVVQTVFGKHGTCYCLVCTLGNECGDVFSRLLLKHGIQRIIESKTCDVVEILFLECRSRHIIGCIDKGEHILEHTRCRTGCRHKLHHGLSRRLVCLPCRLAFVCLGGRGRDDAFAYGCRPFKTEKGETGFELAELMFQCLDADAFRCKLQQVFF